MSAGEPYRAALGGLAFGELGRRVPVVLQATETDCGAACLAMVTAYFGGPRSLREVRDRLGIGRDGVSARAIAEAARALGLRARGVRVDLDALAQLPRGTILHWGFRHFVVLEGVTARGALVVDPAIGRRTVGEDELRRELTGVALVLEPTEGFARASAASTGAGWRRFVRAFVRHRALALRVVALSLVAQAALLAIPGLTGAVVADIVPRGDLRLLGVFAIAAVWLASTTFLVSLLRAYLLVEVRTVIDAETTTAFLEHLLRLPYTFFQRRSAGDLLMRLSSNATIREVLATGVLSACLDGALASSYLVLVALLSPPLAALLVAMAGVQIAVLLTFAARQRDAVTEEIAAGARLEGYQVELLHGIETVKALGVEARATEAWTQRFVDVLNAGLVRGTTQSIFESLLSACRLVFRSRCWSLAPRSSSRASSRSRACSR